MATYRSIAATETDPFAPLTSALMKALDENATAITEGASGAPRILYDALGGWYQAAGTIGSLCFATRGIASADVAFGGTVAGSTLYPASAPYRIIMDGGISTIEFDTGSALSGTWRCLGQYEGSSGGTGGSSVMTGATLWIRIA